MSVRSGGRSGRQFRGSRIRGCCGLYRRRLLFWRLGLRVSFFWRGPACLALRSIAGRFHGLHGFFSFGGVQLRPFGYMPRHLKKGILEVISLLWFGRIDTYQVPKSQLPKGLQFLRRYGVYSGRIFQGFSVSFKQQNHIKKVCIVVHQILEGLALAHQHQA